MFIKHDIEYSDVTHYLDEGHPELSHLWYRNRPALDCGEKLLWRNKFEFLDAHQACYNE